MNDFPPCNARGGRIQQAQSIHFVQQAIVLGGDILCRPGQELLTSFERLFTVANLAFPTEQRGLGIDVNLLVVIPTLIECSDFCIGCLRGALCSLDGFIKNAGTVSVLGLFCLNVSLGACTPFECLGEVILELCHEQCQSRMYPADFLLLKQQRVVAARCSRHPRFLGHDRHVRLVMIRPDIDPFPIRPQRYLVG